MKEQFLVDGQLTFEKSELRADLISQEGNHFSFLIDGKKHIARVDSVSSDGKQFKIRAAGQYFMVDVKTELDQLMDRMGLADYDTQVIGNIEAPMPGRVLEVKVDVGDDVEEGTPLMVLEAMKMENILCATGTGKIERILVKQGATVDKGELLIEME